MRVETVAPPRFSKDVAGLRWIRFDLLPQLVHKHSEVLDFVAVIGAPDRLQNFAVRQDLIRMSNEVVQQTKLRRCKARNTPIRFHLAVAKADLQVLQAKYSRFAEGRDRSSAKRCPNAG